MAKTSLEGTLFFLQNKQVTNVLRLSYSFRLVCAHLKLKYTYVAKAMETAKVPLKATVTRI